MQRFVVEQMEKDLPCDTKGTMDGRRLFRFCYEED